MQDHVARSQSPVTERPTLSASGKLDGSFRHTVNAQGSHVNWKSDASGSQSRMLSQSPLATMRSSAGDAVLHHNWQGKLLASREARKTAEAELGGLLRRLALLQEEEERTRRTVERARTVAAHADLYRSTLTQHTDLHVTKGDFSDSRSMAAATIRPSLSMQGSFAFKSPSPVRSTGNINLPAIASPEGSKRVQAAHGATLRLRQLRMEALAESQAAEAAALRAEKEARKGQVDITKREVYEYCRSMADKGRAEAEVHRQLKEEREREAARRRLLDFEQRVLAEEHIRAATEAKIRDLQELEEKLVSRIFTETKASLASPTRSVFGLTNGTLLPLSSPMRVAQTPLAEVRMGTTRAPRETNSKVHMDNRAASSSRSGRPRVSSPGSRHKSVAEF